LGDVPIAAYIIPAVASGALYWRRYQPLVVLGVVMVGSALLMGLGYLAVHLLGVVISLYSVGRYATNDRWSYLGVGTAVALGGIGGLANGEPASAIAVALFLVWYIGRRIRIRGEYLTVLQERAAHLEREHAAGAHQAVAEERTRIARELHDVVAHRVSLMTVQAGAAKTIAADDPEGARQAMEAVEHEGRQALGELRHLLGVLRPEAEVGGLGPQPGIADVPRLVEQLGRAGLEVSLTTDDLPTDLTARVDLSAYRIVQEALTNVLKHAGPSARTEVRLSTDNQGVAIEVLDRGHGATILPGSGHGIVGMRERALLLGGSLDTGPRPGGGFQVVAYLPIGEEPV
ncbi:MAG: sensor histidine kinase, partial [Acidobacteria bacterium]|nr:sensor histidine kinase [Acidobacteriota bacterium]